MLQKVSFFMALLLILTSVLCSAISADGTITNDDNVSLVPIEEPYVENELLVLTREMLDLSAYEQGELFNFFGVPTEHCISLHIDERKRSK